VPIVELPNYTLNRRGDFIKGHLVSVPQRLNQRTRFVQICGISEAADQIELCAGPECRRVPITDQWRAEYTHRFVAPNGVPKRVLDLVDLLEKDLMPLRGIPTLDFAVVLDWYKVVEEETEPMSWKNTEAGALVSQMKYWKTNPRLQEKAGRALADRMADVIVRHPILAEIPTIVTMPGSKADGASFGERLARGIAQRTEKNLVGTIAINGEREQRKAEGVADLDGEFRMPHALLGAVLIIDDVICRGVSMKAVGRAARFAGSDFVVGLAGVKTMKG
jgi:hypothetical protein